MLPDCEQDDPQSGQLLAAYLDWRDPDWRDRVAGGAAGPSSGPMTRDEALAVLGLSSRASREDIRNAHRNLMRHVHPDRGGSSYLAAKINAAKDVLLNETD